MENLGEEVSATSNLFIREILNRFPWSGRFGVFASDRIPKDSKHDENFWFIINLSPSTARGTHYIALIKKKNVLLYIDPLGLYIELNSHISTFVKSTNVTEVVRINNPIQHPKSWYCGYFCLFFVLYFNEEIKRPDEICSFVDKNLKKNDCIVLHNLSLYLGLELEAE